MATYLILDLFFLAAIALSLHGATRLLPWRRVLAVLAVVVLLTAVFDNLLIALGMFSYTASLISGLHVGRVPLEDFAYALAAAVLVPYLWERAK